MSELFFIVTDFRIGAVCLLVFWCFLFWVENQSRRKRKFPKGFREAYKASMKSMLVTAFFGFIFLLIFGFAFENMRVGLIILASPLIITLVAISVFVTRYIIFRVTKELE